MAAKSKTPLPDSYEDLVEEVTVLARRLKDLTPLVVKAMFPHSGLKRQRRTATDWLAEFNTELDDVRAKLVEAGTVYELATPQEPQESGQQEPEGSGESQSEAPEQTPQQKAAATRARKAAEKREQEGQQESPGGKSGRGRGRKEAVAA